MKKTIAISAFLIGATFNSFGQTNRVSHYSHSGKAATLDIFKSADNMGCGQGLMKEYVPDTTVKAIPDSSKIKTNGIKQKSVNPIPTSDTPRRGMALESKFDAKSAMKKFN